ncbi:MAG TPA: sulfatase-like hydrolase/transferase [Clostridiales bacterium]|nr:sulfatase-like hydrolase/transferase [Clostridiales bacterium]
MHCLPTLLSLLACSLLIALSCLSIQPDSIIADLRDLNAQPVLLFLNWLPVLIVTALLYFIFGNVFYGAAFSSLIFNLLSYANLLKIEGRNDPLTPTDVFLFKEAVNATGSYQLNLHYHLILWLVTLMLAFVLLGIFRQSWRPKPWLRAVLVLFSAGLLMVFTFTVYADKTLYDRLSGDFQTNVTEVYNTLGFGYCFLHNVNLYPIERPEDYDKAKVETWIDDWEADAVSDSKRVKPNVVFVMCEAFSDLANEDFFSYSEEKNPLYDYQLVANSKQAVSGHIVVSNICAGTANTEFDVLTGIETNMVSPQLISAFRCVRRNIMALPRIFTTEGYQTYFMHPGASWFYNRSSVYRYFGVTDQVFKDVFNEADYKGNMVSDAAFLARLEEDFAKRTKESEEPLFAYTVTIQNHQAYTYEKYPFAVEEAPLTVAVSDETKEAVSVYMEGVRDSSTMLLSLTEYLDCVDEPTMVVFFGDHRPALGTNNSTYTELGMDFSVSDDIASVINTYETPFVIWVNQSYYDQIDFADAVSSLSLPKDHLISNIYLGSVVSEIIGLMGEDPYLDYLSEARRVLPVICNGNYYLPDGTYTTKLNETQSEIIDQLYQWKYYRLKDEIVSDD